MIELVGTMLSAWNYTRDIPAIKSDPAVYEMVRAMNRWEVLTLSQMASVTNSSIAKVKGYLAAAQQPVHPGIRGKLKPNGLELCLVAAHGSANNWTPTPYLCALLSQAGDPAIIARLTGISYGRLRRARRLDIQHLDTDFWRDAE